MIRWHDKVLPTQSFCAELYRRSDYSSALAALLCNHANGALRFCGDVLPAASVPFDEMTSPPPVLALLSMLARLVNARTVLEIGSFVGHTALHLASIDGVKRVVTIESGAEFSSLAWRNVERNGMSGKIEVIENRALDALMAMPSATFDLIFLDAAKQDYPVLALQCERLLSVTGVMVIDDVFFHGDALNAAPSTDKGAGCKAVMAQYRDRTDFVSMLLPLGNGLLIVARVSS